MSVMRLCAASRPVSSLPESSTTSPGFQLFTSSRVIVSRFTRRAVCTSYSSFGHASSDGGSAITGPDPSSRMCRCRVAAQFGIMAIGRLAAWVGNSMILMSSTVVSPPRPCAPMPSRFTFS